MIIVAGMHRSGTSMLCNLLFELGANFGDESRFLLADDYNPRGYYEDQEITFFNDRIILLDGAPSREFWMTPDGQRPLSLTVRMTASRLIGYGLMFLDPKRPDRRMRENADKIRELSKQYEGVIVKDARFSILLKGWGEYGHVEKVMYTYRHPFEAAMSLKKRRKLPLSVGYRIWYNWVSDFLKQVEGLPLMMVRYDNFFEEKAKDEMRRLYTFIGKPYAEEKTTTLLSTIVSKELRRNIHSSAKLPDHVAELYERLNAYHAEYGELKLFTPAPAGTAYKPHKVATTPR